MESPVLVKNGKRKLIKAVDFEFKAGSHYQMMSTDPAQSFGVVLPDSYESRCTCTITMVHGHSDWVLRNRWEYKYKLMSMFILCVENYCLYLVCVNVFELSNITIRGFERVLKKKMPFSFVSFYLNLYLQIYFLFLPDIFLNFFLLFFFHIVAQKIFNLCHSLSEPDRGC